MAKYYKNNPNTILPCQEGVANFKLFPTFVRTVYTEETRQLAKELHDYGPIVAPYGTLWKQPIEPIQKLRELFFREATIISRDIYNMLPAVMMNGWINSFGFGHCLPVHDHYIAAFVGTFYVNVEDSTGDIVLIDPRGGPTPGRVHTPNILNSPAHRRFSPKNGAMIFFPGYLLHYVEANLLSGDRTAVSTNFSFPADYMGLTKPDHTMDMEQ